MKTFHLRRNSAFIAGLKIGRPIDRFFGTPAEYYEWLQSEEKLFYTINNGDDKKTTTEGPKMSANIDESGTAYPLAGVSQTWGTGFTKRQIIAKDFAVALIINSDLMLESHYVVDKAIELADLFLKKIKP